MAISRHTFDRFLTIENEIANLKHVQSNHDRRLRDLEEAARPKPNSPTEEGK